MRTVIDTTRIDRIIPIDIHLERHGVTSLLSNLNPRTMLGSTNSDKSETKSEKRKNSDDPSCCVHDSDLSYETRASSVKRRLSCVSHARRNNSENDEFGKISISQNCV